MSFRRKRKRIDIWELIGRIPQVRAAKEALLQFTETMAYAGFALIEIKKDAQKIEAGIDRLKVLIDELEKNVDRKVAAGK